MKVVDIFTANNDKGSKLFARIGWDEKKESIVVLKTVNEKITGNWISDGFPFHDKNIKSTDPAFLDYLSQSFKSGYMWASAPYDFTKEESVEKDKIDERQWLESKFKSLAPSLNTLVRTELGGDYWVSDFSYDQIILTKSGERFDGDNAYFTIDYFIGEDGKPFLSGIPLPVKRSIEYEPIGGPPEEPEEESWANIIDVPKDLREKLNYRLDLAQEWQKILRESGGDEKEAWKQFHLRWKKGKSGRWESA